MREKDINKVERSKENRVVGDSGREGFFLLLSPTY